MSTTYTDRYVSAVVKHLPKDQHAEVEAELRSAIADALDAQGPEDANAEATVLNAMGDPELLAATYADRPLHLIGPRLYLTWKRLTVLLLWIVVPIVAALTAIGGVLGDQGVWAVFGQTMGAAWLTAAMVCFVVTLVFAMIERSGDKEIEEVTTPWTVDKISEPTSPVVGWGETVTAASTLLITGTFLIWQQVYPWVHTADGVGLPVINPDLWRFVLPALLVVMAAELGAVIVRQIRGRWIPRDWWLTLALNLATLALLLPSLLGHTFLNREAFEAMGWPDANSPIGIDDLELIIAGIVLVACLADIIGSWFTVRRSTPHQGS